MYALSNFPYLSEKSLKQIKRKGIPIILNQNGVYFSGWYGSGWQYKNKKMEPAYKLADYVFWQSEFCKISADKFLGKRNLPGEILFNAVDLTKFVPIKKTNNLFTFLTTGIFTDSMIYRLVATIKGFHLFNKIQTDSALIIAGPMGNEAKRKLIDLMRLLNIQDRIKLIGAYSQNSAPTLYGEADAYITMKYMDASPNVVIEAMACGLPIIHSATGGTPELVGLNSGIGLPLEESWERRPYAPEPFAISEAMHFVLANRDRLSLNARLRAVEKFDLHKWIHRHEEVFLNYVN